MKGLQSKGIALKVDVIGAENILRVCRRVHASFSPDILQARAMKGLGTGTHTYTCVCVCVCVCACVRACVRARVCV